MLKRLLSIGLLFTLATFAYADLGLYVYPQEALLNKTISIRVTGIKAGTPVDISATMKDELGRTWKSNGQYVANSAGVVSLGEQAPISGTYLTVDPMGLFWSMQLASDEKDRHVFQHVSLNPIIINLTATSNGQMAKAQITRYVAAKGVTRTPLPAETGLVGNLFLPNEKGPFPTVVVLGGVEGGVAADAYAAQLANEGYATIALAYFKAPGVPDHLANIPLEYFGKAIQWIQQQPQLNARKLTFVGTGVGGTAALLAATYYPQIKAIGTFSGSGFVFQAMDTDGVEKNSVSTFTYLGKSVPYLPLNLSASMTSNTNYYLRLFLGSWLSADNSALEKATVPVENIQGPILMQAGTDDLFWGSAILSAHIYERLSEKHFSYPYKLLNYNGAGYLLGMYSLPYTPTTILTNPPTAAGQALVEFGGNPKDMADAQVASWQALMSFLAKYAR